MKNLILSLFMLSCITAGAQNHLNDLYNLKPGDHYPTNMPHVKQWINGTLTALFVRNLQFSDNARSSSKFISFNPVSRPGFGWVLGVEGLKLLPNGSTISGQYDVGVLNYLRAFDIATFDYQHRSYFLIAKQVLRLTDDQMLANALNYFVESGQKSKYKALIDQVNKIKKEKLSYPVNESVHDLAAVLTQKYPGKISDLIFDCYISDKSEEATLRNMQQFYQVTRFFKGPIESDLDDLFNPQIKFKQIKPLLLQLPPSALRLNNKPDSAAQFSIETGTAVLNYRRRQLELVFKGKMNADADPTTLKAFDYDKNGKITLGKLPPSAKPPVITELDLTVSENGIQLIGQSLDNERYMIIDQRWKE